jgi:hypothetical protein
VNPVLVVVDHVLANQPPQVRFVQRDDVVEKLAATASNPTLCRSVLPGCFNTGALRLEFVAFRNAITSSLNFES